MNINIKERLLSAIIDFGILLAVIMLLSVLIIILSILKLDNIFVLFMAFSAIYSLYLCKDLPEGRSNGKYIVGLKIVNKNNKTPSSLILILRNLFILLWPIDILCCIITPNKKIGDYIFCVKVVHEKKYSNNKRKILNIRNIVCYFITFILSFLFFYLSYLVFLEEHKW